jgi:hypothetical protein
MRQISCFQIPAGRHAPLACIPPSFTLFTCLSPSLAPIVLPLPAAVHHALLVLPLIQLPPPSRFLISFVHPRKCDHSPGVGALQLETHHNRLIPCHQSRASARVGRSAAYCPPCRFSSVCQTLSGLLSHRASLQHTPTHLLPLRQCSRNLLCPLDLVRSRNLSAPQEA